MKNRASIPIVLLAALSALHLQSCSDEKIARVGPRTETCFSAGYPVQRPVAVDILVVVDNSSSMAEEQAVLAETFPSLLRSLLDPPVDPITGTRIHSPVRDLHLGVISTDMGSGGFAVETCENAASGDDGVLQNAPQGEGCGQTVSNYLSYRVSLNSQPDAGQIDQLTADFGCIAMLGTDGCGFEQPLEAALRALTVHAQPGGANQGFLRTGSILTILFVTDEDDCSAADPMIFDPAGFSPTSFNILCQIRREGLHPVDRYFRELSALRENPERLVVGIVVGVPPGEPACNGRGDELARCLDLDDMQIVYDGSYIRPSCSYPEICRPGDDCDVTAYPARRFVELAQMFGDNAVVQSICSDDFTPSLDALTERLRETINQQVYHRPLPVVKDAGDPSGCRCVVPCTIMEELSDDRPCSVLLPPFDSDRDTIPDTATDEEGERHTLCEVPQAGSVLDDCKLRCDDPRARHAKDPAGNGWWYDPNSDPDGDGVTDPVIELGEFEPQEGSGLSIHCCWDVCGVDRACGSMYSRTPKCCGEEEFCYYPEGNRTVEGFCLLRSDICEEYGPDLWCPGAGLLGDDPLIGGLCCLDPEGDGDLDMTDVDGDGLLDTPLYRCDAGSCVSR